MAAPRAAWGIEIGADALKAIRLEREGDSVRVADFAYLPHKRSLVDPEADPDDSIRITLGQFMSQKDLEGEHVVMSVPGHEAFARFAKLPPVEAKKVPDIVRFEAVQQIPFPIEEVEWDYETFARDDSPEVEVGIFAIKRDKVQHRLELYRDVSLVPESLTLSPIALFNAMSYDLGLADKAEPVVILDIGSQSTDVVIAQGGRCWIRTFPLGGNDFTEAIKETFKLGHAKADKLKREASTSKYAKQIMQAMRPVFSDLLQDLQRSLSYYRQMSPDADLTEMIGVGSTFKIPGLRKFIGQQLEINVTRLDEFKRIQVTGREASSFAEHAVNMATAYGLALQGVGLGQIDANLVPVGSLRESLWAQKTKWFAAAAAVVVAGAATTLYHPLVDGSVVSDTVDPRAQTSIAAARSFQQRLEEVQSSAGAGFTGTNMTRLLEDRRVWSRLFLDVNAALASAAPTPPELDADPAVRAAVPAGEARLIRMQSLDGIYVPPAANQPRRFEVSVQVLLTHDDPIEFLTDTAGQWLEDNADRPGVPYRIVPESISVNPGALVSTVTDPAGRLPGDFGGSRNDRDRPGGSGTIPSIPDGGNTPGFGPGGGGRRAAPGGGRSAPGSGIGGDGGGGGPSAAGGGRRARPSGGRTAPGAGVGGGGGESPGFGNPAGRAGRPARPPAPAGRGTLPGGGDEAPEVVNLDEIAPLPAPPPAWPAGVTVHGGIVTFTIELRAPGETGPDLAAAGAGAERGGSLVNARQVMAWIKSNVSIVAFAVVMIAALIALPIVSGKMNADVQARMKKQIQTKKDLERLGRQSVSLTLADGEERTWNTAVNQSLIDGIRDYVDAEASDAEAIVDAAVAFNAAGHEAVLPGRFPPVGRMSETLPEDYHEAIIAAYDALLERVGAGEPPRGASPATALRQQRRRFITGRLQKSETDPLTPEEQAGLAENLAEFRLGLYSDAADAVAFYAERSILPIPEYYYTDNQHVLFGWQWDLWVVTDLLEAIVSANGGPGDEARSARVDPVKRIVSLDIAPLPGFDPAVAPPAAQPSAAAEVTRSYAASHTGRTSNALYDVRPVRLRVIVETRRIPALLDALAEENLITVLDADIKPADPWAAVTEGYYYGNEPVSDVTLELETLWLREWTRSFMPQATRSALGVWTPTETTEGGD